MIHRKKNSYTKRVVIGGVAGLIVLAGIGAFIKRDSVKKFFASDTPATTQTSPALPEPTKATIDYSPSKSTDNDQINEQKNNASDTPTTPVNSSLSATITRAQVSGTIAQIRVLVAGTTTGNCNLTLTKADGTHVDKTASVTVQGTFTTCNGFDVPVTELSNGTWKVHVVVVVNGQQSSAAEATMQVGP